MADDERLMLQPISGYVRTRISRRQVILMLGVLMLVVLMCVTAIGLMLQRLEAKNASFHPPMTESERERLLPPEPRLEVAPSVNGLRYGNQEAPQRNGVESLNQEQSAEEQLLDRQAFLLKGGGPGNADDHSGDVSRAQ